MTRRLSTVSLSTPACSRSRSLAALALAAGTAAVLAALPLAPPTAAAERSALHRSPPNVLLITVDTLRSDRLSGYGYRRPTSPAIDRLLAGGARFDQARTVEPLTNPACSSMLTSLYPHEHGATRNGLRMRPKLPSLSKSLDAQGYMTAAFIGNWTLKHGISGLGEHFQTYEEVLTRKRWLGLFAEEATAEDVNEAAIAWLDDNAGRRRPFFAWAHYVEPHAPYKFQGDVAGRLGIDRRGEASKSDRYDTEIAFVDRYVGELAERIESDPRLAGNTLIVFTSDHGESLGEHGEWGHGRNLYDPALQVPLVFYWPGRIRPQRIAANATNLDIAPTVLGLLGAERPGSFRGFDWTGVLAGRAEPPKDRPTWYQAHKGAVLPLTDSRDARRDGLLELGLVRGRRKEVVQVNRHEHRVFDLRRDPRETSNLNGHRYQPSDELQAWIEHVEEALSDSADAPPVTLDEEDVEQLRALGYVG